MLTETTRKMVERMVENLEERLKALHSVLLEDDRSKQTESCKVSKKELESVRKRK